MAKQNEPLTAAEFDHWLKPADALARLPASWTDREKSGAILRRLSVGSIFAVARRAVVVDANGRTPYEFANVEPKLWSDPWNCRDRDFWKLGEVQFDDAPGMQVFINPLYPTDDRPSVSIHFTDVRFHLGTFEREFEGQLEEEGEDESGEAGTPLAAAELERFARVYLDTFGANATEMKALTAIRAAYSDHSIGRDVFLAKFRELRGPGRVGKPSKTKP